MAITSIGPETMPDWAQYLEWVSISKVKMEVTEYTKYSMLINTLADIPFSYSHPMDENRYNDALSMRKEFESLTECVLSSSTGYMDQATVFEVLAALANRCERQLMRDIQIGDRTKQWFFEMLKNLDVLKWDFEHLQYEYKDDIHQKVNRWLKREIEKDGTGGLFPLKHPRTNQKNEQIWNQMMAYLQENWMGDDGLELYAANWRPSTY